MKGRRLREMLSKLKWRKCLEKGRFNRRHIANGVYEGREYTLHATKGWRVRKA